MTNSQHESILTADAYAREYANADEFERVCVAARQGSNALFLKEVKPNTILEVGCGPSLLSASSDMRALAFHHWAIVEPASAYFDSACEALGDDDRFVIVHGYVESSQVSLAHVAPNGYDAAVISSVIHETIDPLGLLLSVRNLLRIGGRVIVGVPNALSFHRLLAHEAAVISSPFELSDANRRYGQPIVFDPESLAELVGRAGFKVMERGGSLFKPFTNAQMQILTEAVERNLDQALINLGRLFPRNAAEIYVIAEAC